MRLITHLLLLISGYYCPNGSSLATSVICPIGLYCPLGTAQPKNCPPGTYTDHSGADVCTLCPEGKVL